MTKTEMNRRQLDEDIRHNKKSETLSQQKMIVDAVTGAADIAVKALMGKTGLLGGALSGKGGSHVTNIFTGGKRK